VMRCGAGRLGPSLTTCLPRWRVVNGALTERGEPGVASVQKNATGAAVVDLAGSTGCSEASGRA
jgi:hypothetical protein